MAQALRFRIPPGQINLLDRAALAFSKQVRERVTRLITETCFEIEATAKRLAPVDTGRLRASIHSTIEKTLGHPRGFVETNVHYALHVEMGTRYQRAQPFLQPAVAASLVRFQARLKSILRGGRL